MIITALGVDISYGNQIYDGLCTAVGDDLLVNFMELVIRQCFQFMVHEKELWIELVKVPRVDVFCGLYLLSLVEQSKTPSQPLPGSMWTTLFNALRVAQLCVLTLLYSVLLVLSYPISQCVLLNGLLWAGCEVTKDVVLSLFHIDQIKHVVAVIGSLFVLTKLICQNHTE